MSRKETSRAQVNPDMSERPIAQMEPWFDECEAQALFAYMNSGGWVTEFRKTREFEEAIASYTGARHCIVTNNGTVCLSLALLAVGVASGDEVIVPDLTMIATPNSARLLGAFPILVDVEPRTLCMDIDKALACITPKTKAIIQVPLNGRCNNLKRLSQECTSRGLALIEDAAQALGSRWGGRHIGNWGEIGTLSFSAPKVISTGQGGALLTNDDRLMEELRRLKDFGRSSSGNDIHDFLGYNFKFTDLQAVVGIEQMKKLPWRVERKKEIYKRYLSQLEGIGDIEFIPTNLKETSPWFIDIYTNEREELMGYLKERGIGSRPIYPAVHTQKIYPVKGEFPVSSHYCTRGLWLPSSAKLGNEEIDWVCESIRSFYNDRRGNRLCH